MGKFIDLTGHRYGMLTVLRRVENHGTYTMWLCRCDCGAERAVRANTMRLGRTKSCGCLVGFDVDKVKGRPRIHGMVGSREYRSWQAMKQRCQNPRDEHYPDYGGRGITVCDAWQDFEPFLADMGPRPEGTSIDRIDVNGNYEPGNCRWADPVVQANNQRPRRKPAA